MFFIIMDKDKNASIDQGNKTQLNELEENNSFYDITGNMRVWKVHETYEGSGNDSLQNSPKNEKIETDKA